MPSVDELWLEVLQQVSMRAAHEMRGALNGVALNLEVVRARAAAPEASAAGPFAETAADQLALVLEMTEALLALSRVARQSEGPATVVRRFAALLAPAARSEGGWLQLADAAPESSEGPVAAPASIIRLVIGAALLAAVRNRAEVRCRVHDAGKTVVRIERAGGDSENLQIAPDILAAAAAGGVGVQVVEQVISLEFPHVSAARQQRTPEIA